MPILYILITLFLIILLLILAANAHLKCSRLKVLHTPDPEKLEHLNTLISPFGFQYDPAADYFYSEIHCWQRKYGYRYSFDSSAAAFGMIFDCEPVYFDYGGRHWLIEFWKGQYGMSAGAEVGIYAINEEQSGALEPEKRHYRNIGDAELFPIRICLFHKETLIAVRDEKHWWLTAFFPGKYYPPQTLSAKISITFPDYEMCNAYIDGLKRTGYAASDISRCLFTVTVPFAKPRSRQPAAQQSVAAKLRLHLNHFCCFLYQHLTGGFANTLDQLEYLSCLSPALPELVLRFTRMQKRYNRYHKASSR